MKKADFRKTLELQASLNNTYSGENWRKTVSTTKFLTAAFTEIAEFLESIPSTWKWWKKQEDATWESQVMEVIDVYHFMVSCLIQYWDHDTLVEEWDEDMQINEFPEEPINTDSIINELMYEFDQFRNLLQRLTHLQYDMPYAVLHFQKVIYCMAKMVGLDEPTLFKFYENKNAINFQRVASGYRETGEKDEKAEMEGIQ
jgi:dimeric dUTPase (all-alpha-NTP-PPase superfamily)